MHLFNLIWTVGGPLHDNQSMKGAINFNFKPVAWFSYLIITVSPNAILQLPWKNTWFLTVKCKLNITREKNSNVKKHWKNDEKKKKKHQKMYPPYKIPEVDILNIALVGPLITVILWFGSRIKRLDQQFSVITQLLLQETFFLVIIHNVFPRSLI